MVDMIVLVEEEWVVGDLAVGMDLQFQTIVLEATHCHAGMKAAACHH